ncbi:MAG: hypothetical protein GXP31_09700 [Kiritimatiellaeota bacterium]|nr:hypothetical protein [Kiritimatiellota bacterium]
MTSETVGGTRRVYFFDASDAGIRTFGLHLEPCPVEKAGVVFEAEPGVDLDWVGIFAGTVMRLDDGRYRMYYYTYPERGPVKRIGIAESADGFHWERLALGQLIENGRDLPFVRIRGLYDGANITQPSVVRGRDGRWLMYCWLHGQDRGLVRYIVSESDDGLDWRLTDLHRPALFHPADLEIGSAGWTAGLTDAAAADRFAERRQWGFQAAKRLRSNDATNVYYDPETDRYEMYSVWLLPNRPETGRFTPHDNAPGVLRVIHRRTSDDGLAWSDPELVLTPDGGDPLDQQFYYLARIVEGEWRIGFLGNYRCWDQTMDVELCFSRDGLRWRRPLRGGFIPRDPVPEKGCMSAYATNQPVPAAGNRWLLLYTAGNLLHNRQLPDGVGEPWRGVMGVTWPRARYAGLTAASGTIGRILLPPAILSGENVTVDANVRGALRAELRDPLGGRLEGFELHRSVPIRGNASEHVLRWGETGDTGAAYRHDAVVLYCEIEDGVLYSISL